MLVGARTKAICLGLLLTLLLLLSAVFLGVQERYWFFMLRASRKQSALAHPYALRLRNRAWGIRLALKDFALHDSTRGYSSWILITSPLGPLVEEELSEVIRSAHERLSRRLQACLIMYERRHEPSYLVSYVSLTEDERLDRLGLRLLVSDARRQLAMNYVLSEDIRLILFTPGTEPLPLTEHQWRDVLYDAESVAPFWTEREAHADES